MNEKVTEREVKNLIKFSECALALGYCEAWYLLRPLDRWGYTSGVYGWNYDVYEFDDLVVCTGYRRMKGAYNDTAARITRIYNALSEKSIYKNELREKLRHRWAREIKRALKNKR